MKLRRLIPPLAVVVALSSGCAALPFLFGGGAAISSSASESTTPLPRRVFDDGGFVRCRTQFARPGSSTFVPGSSTALRAIGFHPTTGLNGDVVIHFSIIGTSSHPRLRIETETKGEGSIEEPPVLRPGGNVFVGPVTITLHDGSRVRYVCFQAHD